jgi:hypothetical protein
VLPQLEQPRGEFTVIVEIGVIPENMRPEPTASTSTKRETIAALAKTYGVSTNDVYAALEGLRNSGE